MKANNKLNEELFNELTFEAIQEDKAYDVFEDFSIDKDQFINDNLAYIKKLNFKAKVELGKLKNDKAKDILKNKIAKVLEQGKENVRLNLISLIQTKNPQFQFRKLENLDESDLHELLEDIDFLNSIDEMEDGL